MQNMTNRIKKDYTPYSTNFLTIFDYPIYYGQIQKSSFAKNSNDVNRHSFCTKHDRLKDPMQNSIHNGVYFVQSISGNFFNTHSEEYARHVMGSSFDHSITDSPQVRNATTVV